MRARPEGADRALDRRLAELAENPMPAHEWREKSARIIRANGWRMRAPY